MKVRAEVVFEVEPTDDDLTITEHRAKEAAEQAVFDYIGLVDACGIHVDTATVYVDGFGHCTVRVLDGEGN